MQEAYKSLSQNHREYHIYALVDPKDELVQKREHGATPREVHHASDNKQAKRNSIDEELSFFS